jgi:hypothetical protein
MGALTDTRSVNLPAELCAQVEKKFGPKFGGLEQALEFVLRELVRNDSSQADENEQRMIEQRLRDLGYL